MSWKYIMSQARHTATNGDTPRSIYRVIDGGGMESCGEDCEDVVAWVAAGGVIEELSTDTVLDEAIAAISQKYAEKKSALQMNVLFALAADGVTMDTNLGTLRERWADICGKEAEEIMNLFI